MTFCKTSRGGRKVIVQVKTDKTNRDGREVMFILSDHTAQDTRQTKPYKMEYGK